jgi:hypothetical protein
VELALYITKFFEKQNTSASLTCCNATLTISVFPDLKNDASEVY